MNISCNLGQWAVDKFTELSKIGLSMECFKADYLDFFALKRQNVAIPWPTGNLPLDPGIPGIFLIFPNFLRFPKS